MFELILIRHGETVFNSQERLQGGQDSPLTERGEDEARKLGAAMREYCGMIHAWYVSPQGRARQTSGLLREAFEADAQAQSSASVQQLPEEQLHPEIVEIRCGDWEGLRRDEIPLADLKRVHLSTDVAYPNGESIRDVSRRCETFLKEWQAGLPAAPPVGDGPNGSAVHRTVVVSHGNLIRCMGGVLSGLGPGFAVRAMKNNTAVSRFFARERPDPAAVSGNTHLDADASAGPVFRLLTWNNTGHLSGGDPFFSV